MKRTVSTILLVILLSSMLYSAFKTMPAEASETIYIRADGSIDPPTAPIQRNGNLYTLTASITSTADGIVIERNSMTLDGAGYSVQGNGGSGKGIDLWSASNVTIKNMKIGLFFCGIGLDGYWGPCNNVTIKDTTIKNNYYGIRLEYSSGNSISGNNITNNRDGIWLGYSSGNSVSGNNITANNDDGVWLAVSSSNSISGNNITNNGYGISLSESSNNSVSGNNITANDYCGIGLGYSSGNSISGNTITNSGEGIFLGSSNNNSISGNTITNSGGGIVVADSLNSSISGNTFTNSGLHVYYSYQNSVENNTVNGRPLVYLEGASNYTVDDAGQVILVRCENITVEGLNLSKTTIGVELWETINSTISGNTITNNMFGIELYSSSNSTISGNNIANNGDGILLSESSNSSISGNNITANNYYGIKLYRSSSTSISGNTFTNEGLYVVDSYQNSVENNTVNGRPLVYLEGASNYTVDDAGQVILVRCENITVEGLNLSKTTIGVELWETVNSTISGNTITNSGGGIVLYSSSNSTISGNNITANYVQGICLVHSSGNSISGNNITANNWAGIELYNSSGNKLFHNSFVNNINRQVISTDSVNVWDDGYPSGGNYWSDSKPADVFSGPYQNESGSDRIGDTPYIIDENNTDNYPLIYPYGYVPSPDFNNDGIIDIFDIVRLALAFGSVPGMPNWDPYVDLNQDGIIDIFDLVVVALRFGETV